MNAVTPASRLANSEQKKTTREEEYEHIRAQTKTSTRVTVRVSSSSRSFVGRELVVAQRSSFRHHSERLPNVRLTFDGALPIVSEQHAFFSTVETKSHPQRLRFGLMTRRTQGLKIVQTAVSPSLRDRGDVVRLPKVPLRRVPQQSLQPVLSLR